MLFLKDIDQKTSILPYVYPQTGRLSIPHPEIRPVSGAGPRFAAAVKNGKAGRKAAEVQLDKSLFREQNELYKTIPLSHETRKRFSGRYLKDPKGERR